MRQFKRFSVLMLIAAAMLTTGCDATKILDVITKVAEGVQKAIPAIKEVVNTVQQVTQGDNTATPAPNTPATETPAKNDATVVVTNPGDEEEVGNNPTTPTSTGTSTATDTTGNDSEAALANYRGGRLAPAEFGRLFGPAAQEASRRSGVPASIILAQAALETGWGSSSIGNAKNLFGIKGTGPAGSVTVPTQEYRNGRMVTENASFRKYNTWQESIEDHSRLLQNSRYANAMRNRDNPDQFARELQRAGYATDPEYASKLISIMKSNNFYRFN